MKNTTAKTIAISMLAAGVVCAAPLGGGSIMSATQSMLMTFFTGLQVLAFTIAIICLVKVGVKLAMTGDFRAGMTEGMHVLIGTVVAASAGTIITWVKNFYA